MAKPDYAHRMTDKELAKLEKRIFQIYQQAKKELDKTISEYFSEFRKRDEEMKKLVGTIQNGKEWTEQDYINWRLAQIGRGERFEDLRDKIAERMTKANETATAYVNDTTPGIYTLNRNYAAYTIEQVAGNVGFTLWDEQTVKRLIVEEPDLMPYYPQKKALNRGIDLVWGKKQITASITSSILQGKSIRGMADDLQNRITTMNRTSSIRTARTAVTGAQNAGRMDSYHAAEKMGIKMKKEWVATLDNRTRHAHAVLDGQRADVDKPFRVDGREIRFPGDQTAPGYLVYNCRCTLVAAVDGVDTSDAQRRARNPETGERELVTGTYLEWARQKEAENKAVWDVYVKKGKNLSSDKRQQEAYGKILGTKIPQNIDDFQNLKYNDTEKWSFLKLDYARRTKLKNHPEMALPEADRTTAAPAKFTEYLFNPNNPDGWAKGEAFTSRLGYSAENWEKLRREIIQGAKKYPAIPKSKDNYGQRYEQNMVLYGETGRPANVRVGWIQKEDGSVSMTTAYIKEVKL